MNEKKDAGKVGTASSGSASDSNSRTEGYGEFEGEVLEFIGIGTWSPHISKASVQKEEPNLTTLSSFEAAMACVILDDAIKELVILKYVIGDPMDSSWDLYYRSRSDKFTRRLTPERIFPEAGGRPILTPTIKLQRDRELVESILFRLMRALQDAQTIVPLVWAVHFFREEIEDEGKLISDLKANLLNVKDLKASVEEKRRLDDLEERERDEFMYQLQDEMDDVMLQCEVEEKFVKKWETVRVAQNQLKLRNSENYYKDNITKFNTKARMEKRVTHELQLYLKFNQAELEEQLEEWMSVYDSEMERRENKIIQLKYDRDQREEKKQQLQKLYEDRKKEMREWVIFRDNRRKKMKASLIIQSWWRGMMVRKKLGPYKQKKQKPEEVKPKKK